VKRRQLARRTLSAEHPVDLWRKTATQQAGASREVVNHAAREALAEYGYVPLDALGARYWLRRGKPADYRWNE
jgi:hypothetical protein